MFAEPSLLDAMTVTQAEVGWSETKDGFYGPSIGKCSSILTAYRTLLGGTV